MVLSFTSMGVVTISLVLNFLRAPLIVRRGFSVVMGMAIGLFLI